MKRMIMSTQNCLCFILIFAQIFGMLPVSGITKNSTFLKFRWYSKRTLYSILFTAAAAFNTICQLLKLIRVDGLEFEEYVSLLFFAVTVLTVVAFIDVARKWPKMMEKWTEVDMIMNSYGFPPHLHKKLKIVTSVFMVAAIVEHILFISFKIKNNSHRSATFMESVNTFLQYNFEHIFAIMTYNILWGILIEILNIFSTISWNFMDVFIMVVSICLSARFSQIVNNIRILVEKRNINENVWRKLREDYTKVSELCKEVDNTISNIILLSFGNNIFVVIVQLFNSTRHPTYGCVIDEIYYLYSLLFLIIRTITVALYGATINAESKKPAYYLTLYGYNTEIERFIYQTKYDTPALTAHKLLKVTNALIFKMAAAIVSYELVVIEFLR